MNTREQEKIRAAKIQGTREWAVAEINCSKGCPHGCLYCYARHAQAEKNNITDRNEWLNCRPDETALAAIQKTYSGQVMFPAAHDIVTENLKECLDVLLKLLEEGNSVLVVSKPSLHIVKELCSNIVNFKRQIIFRFTITARNHKILKVWEPFAPLYKERKQCLEYAFENGFTTSVSVEPILDIVDVPQMVEELLPFVNHSIWLGKMNKIDKRVVVDSEEVKKEVQRIKEEQSDAAIHRLYEILKMQDNVRWKESIKDVIGLPRATSAGLDI